MTDDELPPSDLDIDENIPPFVLGICLLYGIVLAFGLFWCWIGDYGPQPSLSASETLVHAGIALALALAIVALVGVVERATSLFDGIIGVLEDRLGDLSGAGVIALSLFSSVAEEVLFRGAMQPAFSELFRSEITGWVTTSLVFGLLHTGPSRQFIPWTVFAVLSGFVLGYAYLRTGNLLIPIVTHFIINALNMWRIVLRARRRPDFSVHS
ncbi:MAG: CPBP family intramembrane metalloprotease [Planctomycetes bacterium]|nr:CPBP family intramembrane metalloprotease [Planctomycetota bacterium]